MYDQYIEEFGLSKEYIDLLENKKAIAILKNEFIHTGDRGLLNNIEMEEMELISNFDKGETIRFESVVAGLEKHFRREIDIKTITVYKYNNYLRTLSEKDVW